MAKSALIQLQDQIDAIRKEAYAAGYAAAMQVIQKAAGGGAAAPAPRRGRPPAVQPAKAAAAKPARVAKAARPAKPAKPARVMRRRRVAVPAAAASSGSRPRRGNNAQLVSEVLQAIAPQAARPAEIRAAVQRDKGVSLAFTSIRHALGQLETRKAVEQVGDSKTWRHKA